MPWGGARRNLRGKLTMTATAPPAAAPRTSGLSIASLVCGILALPTLGLTGLPAIITGHLGLSSIKKSGGALAGRGMAIAGLVTGYLGFSLIVIAIVAGLTAPLVMRQKMKADRMQQMTELRELGGAFLEFKEFYGAFPSDALTSEPGLEGLGGPYVLQQLEMAGNIYSLQDELSVRRGQSGDWIYFPEGADDAAPLLAAPPIGDRRVVLMRDGTVRELPADMPAGPDAVHIPAPVRQ